MGKLVPFNKSFQKQMGFVNTKTGPMFDSSKVTLTEKKNEKNREEKNSKKENPKKEVKKPKVSAEEKTRLENRGIY